MRFAHIGVALAFTALATTAWAQAPARPSCEQLSTLTLAGGARITAAQSVAAGTFTPPNPANAKPFKELPAFCRVTAEAPRANDTPVTLEVWLPAPSAWTGDFQPAASGFGGGRIGYGEMRTILGRNIATANTNRGLDSGPWKPANLSAVPYNLMVEHAKAIVSGYYGSGPKLTFMNECGGSGSRDLLQVLQKYPAGLDAAVAEGIIYRPTRHGVSQMWAYQASHPNGTSILPPATLALLRNGALKACDAKDGLADGVISDPPRCAFDPAVLECKANADPATCLTAQQVAAAKQIYSVPRDPRTKKELYPRFVPGSELSWQPLVSGPNPYPYAQVWYRNIVMQDPEWTPAKKPATFTEDLDRGDAWAAQIDANDGDIKGFLSRGGKLIIIGGWTDNLPPEGNIEYYNDVVKSVGREMASRSVRLFMVPGMHHCLGEEFPANATTDFDAVAAVKAWKAGGPAPEQIVVTQTEKDGTKSKRMVCSYPRVAHYNGKGDPQDMRNFTCRMP